MVEDALVEALEARREKREGRLLGELLHELLVELSPLRGERDDAMVGSAAVHRIECRGDHVDAQHHARASAVRFVVHLARAERCGVAVVEDVQLELSAEHRGERPALPDPRKGVRHEREDIEAHDAEP